jgi:hypothetical protein
VYTNKAGSATCAAPASLLVVVHVQQLKQLFAATPVSAQQINKLFIVPVAFLLCFRNNHALLPTSGVAASKHGRTWTALAHNQLPQHLNLYPATC